jgi:asparagine synthase (glutamine-hydrolysing)
MCGIAGICLLRGSGSVSVEMLSRMTGILRHRGPDESGIYVDDRVGLGHARLSIIDLAGGTQPIPNEDESLWIVFNGEIFNYPELRETLVSRGHRFRTLTDTEVIRTFMRKRARRAWRN